MSGKAYSLRELKTIVDYLKDNHLYGETRGRKMWTDFANSKITVRTWQSLKETFLKRILPDITNPYYRLDPEQILSFKRGIDLVNKNRKLEMRPVDNSNSSGANEHLNQPSTSKDNNEEMATGEDTQCSKLVHNRASTETLILDTCYQTAEDISIDLGNTNKEESNNVPNKHKAPVKSVRDFIEYTEPLTPMLQEVLDDFATDEEGSDIDRPMQIDENYVAPDEVPDVASQSILNPKTQNSAKLTTTGEKDVNKTADAKQATENNMQAVETTDDTAFSQLEDVMVLVDEVLAKNIDKELGLSKIDTKDKEGNSNTSIPLTDSLLPNNQEGVKNASTSEVHSAVQPTVQDDKSSDTHLISDEEPAQKGPDETLTFQSHAERTSQKEQEAPKSPERRESHDDKVHEIQSDSSSTGKKATTPELDNPCLKNVSLYAEQLVTTKYSDSDTNNKVNENVQRTKQDQNNDKTKENSNQEVSNEDKSIDKENTKEKASGVIHLDSRTTSESVDDSEVNRKPLARLSLRIQKDKQLANVFGFTNDKDGKHKKKLSTRPDSNSFPELECCPNSATGGVPKSRKLNGRKRTTSHRNRHSDSSEWSSESDSEYVSPPHGRRNRYARKYLKPRSARILSLEEEGGLFVMLGKKVYPIVKDGRMVKNYVTFLPESDPEEDDNYWKSKYIEERKRTADLKKKLTHPKANGVLDKDEKERSISVSSVTSPLHENRQRLRQESIQGNEIIQRYSGAEKPQQNKETLKIKFTKNDQEVQLEGHWQHINPVLAQVVSMLHKESTEKKPESVTCVELSSGNTTPVITPTVTPPTAPTDIGVREKVKELETAIFKEIEENDKNNGDVQEAEEQKENQEKNNEQIVTIKDVDESEKVTIKDVDQSEKVTIQDVDESEKVTQRKKRGRPKKSPSPALVEAIAQSPAKRRKKSVEQSKPSDEESKTLEVKETPIVGRPTRSPRKLLDVITVKAKTTRKSASKVQPKAPVEITETEETPATEEPDDEIRYRFPSPEPVESTTKTSNLNKKHLPKINITSPDSLSRHSVNSSQGYQDSDTSPFHINLRRKRRISVSSLSLRGKKMHRRRNRSLPLLKHVYTDSDSSCSITFKTGKEQSTVNSEVYRSDSYHFLMPALRTMERLEKIDEAHDNNDGLATEIRKLREEIMKANTSTNKSDAASSSILSLPISPELSIVENLSLSKSEDQNIDRQTLGEMEGNASPKTFDSQYLMSGVDVSIPLMAQDCQMREKYRKHLMAAMSNLSDLPNSAGQNFSINSSMRMSITSESILKDYPATEASDSLDKRLEQLLLESAQKPTPQNKGEKMEVETEVKKKSGSRKRCSTPHKKNAVPNKKKINAQPIIEEEFKSRCARGGRRSCPPSINIVYCEQNPPENVEINICDENIDVTAVTNKKRIKKDVIKVKIVRPKAKAEKKKSPKKKIQNVSQTSGKTEGDNESGVFLQGLEESSELIHNHSETCLQIGDCMGEEDSDSVEFIETTSKSIVSLSSGSFALENKENGSANSMDSGKTSAELYCDNDNAQCATSLRDATVTEARSADSGNTMYFTPFDSRCNSVLTEDRSQDEPILKSKTSKWYLLSEDQTNTNYFDVQEETRSYGANLNQIFPITCAIPDLSTITEMSEKNTNSPIPKAYLEAKFRRKKK